LGRWNWKIFFISIVSEYLPKCALTVILSNALFWQHLMHIFNGNGKISSMGVRSFIFFILSSLILIFGGLFFPKLAHGIHKCLNLASEINTIVIGDFVKYLVLLF
jgi:hypothetical protein